MINSLPPYILYLLAILASFVVSLYAVRKIIFITKERKIFDIPDNTRKIHGAQIPSLGGIGVFTAYIVTAAFFMFSDNTGWNYILISSVILFFTGIYDDLMNMRPLKKLAAQFLASAITVYFTLLPALPNYYLHQLHGVPYLAVAGIITLICTFFINAFNFIDGIDGLASSLAILYTVILGSLFASNGQTSIAGTIFCITGATVGLLYFNRTPAKIYMGDTGSMFLGFNIFVFSALFVFTYRSYEDTNLVSTSVLAGSRWGAASIVFAVLFLPMYDAIRVFILRLSKKGSPLKADRLHLHYYLLDAGIGHAGSVGIIVVVSFLIIAAGYLLQNQRLFILAVAPLIASTALFIIYRLRQKKLSESASTEK